MQVGPLPDAVIIIFAPVALRLVSRREEEAAGREAEERNSDG